MNSLYLTKISKHVLIGSVSAYLSFASKANPQVRLFFIYLVTGILVTFLIAALWEARDYLVAKEANEETLSTIIGGLTNSKPETRKYYLPAKVRLEIVITLVVIVVCGLIGAL